MSIILRYIVLPVLLLWALAFAFYNYDLISVNLWPLPFVLMTPLSLLLLIALIIGYFLGAMRGFLKMLKLRDQNKAQQKQLDKLGQQFASPQ